MIEVSFVELPSKPNQFRVRWSTPPDFFDAFITKPGKAHLAYIPGKRVWRLNHEFHRLHLLTPSATALYSVRSKFESSVDFPTKQAATEHYVKALRIHYPSLEIRAKALK